MIIRQSLPSFKTGFARSAGESANPSLWKGLVGAWVPALGPTGTTLRDVSGRQNDGTLTSMDPGTDWVVKEKWYSLQFNGSTTEYISIGDPEILAIDQYASWCIWFYWLNYPGGSNTTHLMSKRSAFATQDWQIYFTGTSGEITMSIGNSAATILFAGTSITPSLNAWHNLTITRNGSAWTMFLNGKSVATDSSATSIPNGTDVVTIGKAAQSFSSVRSTNGYISQSKIYNRALTANEIAFDYANPLAPFRLKPLIIATGGAAPAGGFQSAWASGSNRIIQ